MTITVYDLSADQVRTEPAAALRRQLREGLVWSRLNPDLLATGEYLPIAAVAQPPSSPAALLPFPVLSEKIETAKCSLTTDFLTEQKIDWCYHGRRKAGAAVSKRVAAQLAHYNLQPLQKARYCWFTPDPSSCPYTAALNLIFPAIKAFALAKPVFPEPVLTGEGEAWRSTKPDGFGVDFLYSVSREDDHFTLALALTRGKTIRTMNYSLTAERFAYFKQQLFFMLNTRLQPWRRSAEAPNPFRGMIYKKP